MNNNSTSFRFSTPQTIADDLENLHSDLHEEENHRNFSDNESKFNDIHLIENTNNDDLEQKFTISHEDFGDFEDFDKNFFNESQRINDRDLELFSNIGNVSDYDLINDIYSGLNNSLIDDIDHINGNESNAIALFNISTYKEVLKETNDSTNYFNVHNKSFNDFEDYNEIELKNTTLFLDNKMDILDSNWLQLPNLFVLILIIHFVLCMLLLLFVLLICLKSRIRKSRRKSRKFARSLSRRLGSNVYWMSERGGAVTSSSFRSSPPWPTQESFYKREETPASPQQHVAVIQPKLRISRPLAPRPFGLDIELDEDNEKTKTTEVATSSLSSFGHTIDSDNGVYASPYADFAREESVLYEAPIQKRKKAKISNISKDDEIDANQDRNEDESDNVSNDQGSSSLESGKQRSCVLSESEVGIRGSDVIN